MKVRNKHHDLIIACSSVTKNNPWQFVFQSLRLFFQLQLWCCKFNKNISIFSILTTSWWVITAACITIPYIEPQHLLKGKGTWFCHCDCTVVSESSLQEVIWMLCISFSKDTETLKQLIWRGLDFFLLFSCYVLLFVVLLEDRSSKYLIFFFYFPHKCRKYQSDHLKVFLLMKKYGQ